MHYIISETNDGRFILQRPNGMGGLYPLIPVEAECRNTKECFDKIHADSWGVGSFEDISITLRFRNDPDNSFTN